MDSESQSRIEKEAFGVMVNLIRLLDMQGLWSSGIPELKRFIFILQEYMKWVLHNNNNNLNCNY